MENRSTSDARQRTHRETTIIEREKIHLSTRPFTHLRFPENEEKIQRKNHARDAKMPALAEILLSFFRWKVGSSVLRVGERGKGKRFATTGVSRQNARRARIRRGNAAETRCRMGQDPAAYEEEKGRRGVGGGQTAEREREREKK